MSEKNLWPKAKFGKQARLRNPTGHQARNASEADRNPQGGNSQTEHPLSSPVEFLTSLFDRFLKTEEQGNVVNEEKATIFADAKAAGLDARALRAAFRQRVRELEKPDAIQKHDALNGLTASYLGALRGDEDRIAASPVESIDVLPWSPVAPQASSDPLTRTREAEACSEPLARSRTREASCVEDPTVHPTASSEAVRLEDQI